MLAKIDTLVSTFPGPGLPPEWISSGSPATVVGNAAQIPAATDFKTNISTIAFYDPTNTSIYGKLLLSSPRSYTTVPAPPAFTPYNRIGLQQPGGAQVKTLSGYYPGFTVGQQAHGQMKPTMDNLETLIGDHIEAVGVGMPNSLGDCSGVLSALFGETRFVVFAVPMVPNPSTGTKGSLTTLLAGGYDALIIDMTNKMVAAGFAGDNVSCRIGWEYNAGSSAGPTDGFPWATNYGDPQNSGNPNGIAKYKSGAAYFENLMRAHGYAGYIEWNGGNHDTSALPIATAMPTHATTWKSHTLWGWDVYAATPFNVGKDNVAATITATNSIYDAYLTYVKANGYLMAHGEYGMGYTANSPYSLNDNDVWYPWFYGKLAANAKWVAYAMYYGQNQPYSPGTILDESHQLFFCGGRQGVPSTTVGTGPNAIGATTFYTKGPANTSATMGTLHNVADSGTWVLTNDPNRAKARDSWLANFGGTNGKGAATLGVPYVAPTSPVTNGPKAQVILTPGGVHSPTVQMLLEFDYDKTQSSLTVNFADDGTGVNTAAVATSAIWWRMRDDGTNVHWETSTDAATWTNLRTAVRPSWWNATDGVQVKIAAHNDDGTQTISPLIVSNINTLAGAGVVTSPDVATFDKFNIASGPPGPVQGLGVHVTGTTAAVTWSAPASGIVQGYIVSVTPLNTSSPVVAPQTVTATGATFFNLTNGASYLFTVQPFNSAGTGQGVSSGAVNILGTVVGGTPTPALGGGLPNALPTIPLPAAYRPLLLTTDADDGDSLANAAIQRLANLIGNGWRPYLSNPEVAAVQVASFIAADLRALVRDAGASMFAAYGQQLLQNPQRVDSPSIIVTTWTCLDSLGHTIPAGTQVSYPGAGSDPLTFTLRGDIVIETGDTAATGIVMISDQTGAFTNQVPTGPLEIQGSFLWLDSVVVTTAASGGADPESDADYLNRLVAFIRTLGQVVVLPADYASYAVQSSDAVYRAYAVPNYDANNPSTHVDRTVSVFLLGADGLPVAPDVAADVEADLQSLRESNFTVVVRDGSGNAIAPAYVTLAVTATVVARVGYAPVDVKAACERALGDYLSPAYWEGGFVKPPQWTGRQVLRPHDLSTILSSVPGVDHIDALAIGGGAVPITGTDNYTLSTSGRAVLPAGTAVGSHWTTPTTIVVTANAPAIA